MRFTEKEIQFLLGPCVEERVEGRTIHQRRLFAGVPDARKNGMPDHLFEKFLERRSQKFGNKFIEFRAQQGSGGLVTPDRIETARLQGRAEALLENAQADLKKN